MPQPDLDVQVKTLQGQVADLTTRLGQAETTLNWHKHTGFDLTTKLDSTSTLVSPGGNNKDIQFNDSGAFGGSDDFQFDKAAVQLLIGHTNQAKLDASLLTTSRLQKFPDKAGTFAMTVDLPAPAGANHNVQYNNSGVFGGDNGLTWDGVNLVVSNSGVSSIQSDNFVGAPLIQASLNLELISNHSGTLVSFIVGQYTTTTSNATPVNVVLTGTVTGFAGLFVEIYVRAVRTSGAGTTGDCAGYIRRAVYKNSFGTLTIVGSVQDGFTAEDVAGWDCTLGVSGTDIVATLTGAGGTGITWYITSNEYF